VVLFLGGVAEFDSLSDCEGFVGVDGSVLVGFDFLSLVFGGFEGAAVAEAVVFGEGVLV